MIDRSCSSQLQGQPPTAKFLFRSPLFLLTHHGSDHQQTGVLRDHQPTGRTLNRRRLVLCYRAFFPGRKQMGKDNVLILSCCHKPSCITLGLYWSSAASDILCRLAVGLSPGSKSRQWLASKAVSGLGRCLQSSDARILLGGCHTTARGG